MTTHRVTKVSMELEGGRRVDLKPDDAFYRVNVNGPTSGRSRGDGLRDGDYFTHEVRWTTPLPALGEGD